MINISYYDAPISRMILASKNNRLIGVWFEGQRYYMAGITEEFTEKEDEILVNAKRWLDQYFEGKNPSIDNLDLAPEGTEFRKSVWKVLCEIPYGKTVSYNDIARKIAQSQGIKRMSAQAVGGAVGHNPISVIIPCHRVIASDGSLGGYAGGVEKKEFLLKHESPAFGKNF